MQEDKSRNSLRLSHLGLILMVMFLLVGVSWMKNPQVFDFIFKAKKKSQVSQLKIPSYYAYVPDASLHPLVAGASTGGFQGPSIINEDGSISPAIDPTDFGSVLGISTESVKKNFKTLNLQIVPDSEEAARAYINRSREIEKGFTEGASFEVALTSGSQKLIDKQTEKIKEIVSSLLSMQVPKSFSSLHKLKITQYNSAINILQNFLSADANPELVTKALGTFLETQALMENEAKELDNRFNLNV